MQINGVRSGREEPSGYRYPPPPPPPLARNGTRWEAPAASLAPAQAYPESILGCLCKGASQSPGRGGKEAKTSSSGQGPGSCLLLDRAGLPAGGLLLLGLDTLQTGRPGNTSGSREMTSRAGKSPRRLHTSLLSLSCPRSPRRSWICPDHTRELHPAECMRSVSSRETAALSAAVSCFSTKQSATWAPLFFPLMQLHKT